MAISLRNELVGDFMQAHTRRHGDEGGDEREAKEDGESSCRTGATEQKGADEKQCERKAQGKNRYRELV